MKTSQRQFVSLIAVLWAFSAATDALAADNSLFGIRIGAPLPDLPDCVSKIGAATGERYYPGDDADLCLQSGSNGPDLLFIPKNMRPDYLSVHAKGLSFSTIDGKVALITLFTNGISSQDEVLKELQKKFGNAASITKSVEQNGFGARYASTEARWALRPRGTVWFSGIWQSADQGRVRVSTPEGIAAEEAKKRAAEGRHPVSM